MLDVFAPVFLCVWDQIHSRNLQISVAAIFFFCNTILSRDEEKCQSKGHTSGVLDVGLVCIPYQGFRIILHNASEM